MITPADLAKRVNSDDFLRQAVTSTTVGGIEQLLAQLPIVSEDDTSFDSTNPSKAWKTGHLHWLPVGRDRGNAGRIKLANQPVNPMAERIVNGMEALIELMRALDLLDHPSEPIPQNPRAAVKQYFGLPSLDEIPKIEDPVTAKKVREKARELARKLRVRLLIDKKKGQWPFTVVIEDEGIGQPPDLVHATLLSLGTTTKGDKPYMIGLFGQGGSSAYAISQYSWVISRRAPQLLNGNADGVGWSVVKQIFPKGRRDPYFAYLAASPDGQVLTFPPESADALGIKHGTRFAHIGLDFQKGGSAIVRNLYPALNHVLYNPMLPYELYAARDEADVMWGNAYRLSNLSSPSSRSAAPVLDKTFAPQSVGTL